jgi:hypothetical protein
MKCIKPEMECRFRDEKGFCHWDCPYDEPGSDCPDANICWGCPWMCAYEALDPTNSCNFKDEVRDLLSGKRRWDEP